MTTSLAVVSNGLVLGAQLGISERRVDVRGDHGAGPGSGRGAVL
jgi:hypothetical protein